VSPEFRLARAGRIAFAVLLRVLLEVLRDPQRGLAALPVLPDILLLSLLGLLVGLTIHETAHALVAHWLGDPTARLAGRISLNPLRHLDPFGTMMLLVVGIGWGKPVPINPFKLRFGPLRGPAVVALAGPLANIGLAGVLALPIRLGVLKWHSPAFYPLPFAQDDPAYLAADVLGYFIFFNIMLAAFNVVPIAPLDGARLLGFLLPQRALPLLQRYEVVGPLLLGPVVLLLLAVDLVSGSTRLANLIAPLANLLALVIIGRPLLPPP
jgi:Zn-dependent protease